MIPTMEGIQSDLVFVAGITRFERPISLKIKGFLLKRTGIKGNLRNLISLKINGNFLTLGKMTGMISQSTLAWSKECNFDSGFH